jgi:hypothetical protein
MLTLGLHSFGWNSPLSVRIVVTPSEKTPEGDGVTNETYFTGA